MNRDRLYLGHMLESIEKIESYTVDGKDAFMDSPMVRDAVARNFEIIGEASKRLSDQAKSAHPQVPWREIAGFRDILIHNYEGVDYLEVWNVIVEHLPRLRRAVGDLLEE